MSKFKIVSLKVNYLENPVGLGSDDVIFSWSMESKDKNVMQSAYAIRVASDKDMRNIIWDSGIVPKDTQVGINYSGKPLKKGERYYWDVKVFDEDLESSVSDISYFELARPMDQVKWIYAGREKENAPFFRYEFSLEDKKIKKARLYMTAMGVYRAFINAKEVFNPNCELLNPGWTDYEKYVNFQTFDITDLLKKGGKNAIGIMVGGGWYQSGFRVDYSKVFDVNNNDKENKKLGLSALIVVTYEDMSEQSFESGDRNWKYTEDTPIISDSFYNGESYDAIKAGKLAGWNESDFDDSTWKEAKTAHYIGKLLPGISAGINYAHDKDLDPVSGYIYRESENIAGTNSGDGFFYGSVKRHPLKNLTDINLSKDDILILDMGQNMVGFTSLYVSGKTGTDVRIRFAEMLNDGRKPSADSIYGSDGPNGTLYRVALRTASCTDHYIMSGDEEEHYQQSFTYRGFRYVEIKASEDIMIKSLEGIVISSVKKRSGFIKTSDPLVNRLVENSAWSEMGNYISIPTDCPQRDERAAWSGDAQVFAQTALMNFDTFAFLKNYTGIMKFYQEKYGVYGPIMPDGYLNGWKASGWSDAGIIIPWILYINTGDISFLKDSYENMCGYMKADNSLPVKNEDSFMPGIDQDTGYSNDVFGDWLAYSGASLKCINLIFKIYTLRLMGLISGIIGKDEEKKQFETEASKYREFFIKKYIDKDHNLLSASVDNVKEQDNVYSYYPVTDNAQSAILWALKLGLYPDEDTKKDLLKKLLENIQNKDSLIRPGQEENTLSVGFLGVNIILPVLSDMGLNFAAYDLLLQDKDPSWLYAVKNGATTTWERWNSYSKENGFGNSTMNSFNHYSYGSCVEWIYQYVLGISPDIDKPGYKRIILKPTVDPGGRITEVDGKYLSLYGEIESGWKAKDGKMTALHFKIPANTSAVLYLPRDNDPIDQGKLPYGIDFKGVKIFNGRECDVYNVLNGSYEF